MWIIYAFLSAIFAALVAIFGKVGLNNVDSTLATTVRSIIMAVFLILVTVTMVATKKTDLNFSSFSGKAWLFITLSGIAGALSWLFYFLAIKLGLVGPVAAIDRTSIIFVVVLSALFLGEAFTWRAGLGALFIAIGAFLISANSEFINQILTFLRVK